MSRRRTWGSLTTASTVLMGATGTPSSWSAASHSAVVRAANTASSPGTSSSRRADALRVRVEPRVAGQLGPRDRPTEPLPKLLREDRHHHVAVPRAEGLVRDDRGVPRAHASRHAAVRPEVLRDVREERDLAVEQRQVELRPFAGLGSPEERARDRERAEHPAREVPHRETHPGGRPARLAREAHRAPHRLEREVERRPFPVRPVLAEGRDGADHQPRVQLPEGRRRAPEPGHHARAEVLPDDIRHPAQVVEHVAALGGLEIQRDALLVPVDRQEVGAVAVGAQEGRPHGPHGVTSPRVLDLDDLGPEIGEQHRAIRTGEHPRQVEHSDAVEKPHRARGLIAAGPERRRTAGPPGTARRRRRRGRSPRSRRSPGAGARPRPLRPSTAASRGARARRGPASRA